VDGLVGYLANDRLDEDGRPLGEVSSTLYDRVETEVVACPYPDGRHRRPMNRTALRQVSSVWPSVLATLQTLSRPNATVHHTWKIALIGIAAPLLSPVPTSRGLSALYKACLGLSQVTTTLLLEDDGVAAMPFCELGSGTDFYTALDQHGWLLGQVQVCAGPAAMLVQMGEVLAHGGSPSSPPLPLPDPWRMADLAARTVSAHATYWVQADVLRARGASIPPRLLPPWLRAVATEAFRPPAHIRRLFPPGEVPAEVEQMLQTEPQTVQELEEAFERALRGVKRK
jgi:hypothetical protein